MGTSKTAILRTIIYSDIFDYPLKENEIWKFLIGRHKVDKQSFYKILPGIKGVDRKDGFYFLTKRNKILSFRLKREDESILKIQFAKKIINRLRFIPTIKFIGISGALAMLNSDKDDDIDLFVIAGRNSIWTTRILIIAFLKLMGAYRQRQDKTAPDRICLNMLIDESKLSFPKNRQDLYTAHEVVQLLPLFQRDNTHSKFIKANTWVGNFLPNAVERVTNQKSQTNKRKKRLFTVCKVFSVLERFAKKIQLFLIRKHRTTEEISDNLLAFHPFDYRKYVLELYEKRLKRYKIK